MKEDSSGSNVEDMRNWLKALVALVWGTKAQTWSSTQRQDESSRNATRHGLQTVPESSQKQEDRVNSATSSRGTISR